MTILFDAFQSFALNNRFNLFPEMNAQGVKPMKIELFHRYAQIELSKGVFKKIPLEDFKEMVLSGMGDKKVELSENLILPSGCFNTKVSTNGVTLYCYYPEAITTVKYENRSSGAIEEFTIPLPNFVIEFPLEKTNNGTYLISSSSVRYGITDKTVAQLTSLDGEDYLQHTKLTPFTNFYNDRRMCFGRNSMPTNFTRNLRGLDYYYNIISISPFNEDLGVVGTRDHYNAKTWFTFLARKTSFPYESLS